MGLTYEAFALTLDDFASVYASRDRGLARAVLADPANARYFERRSSSNDPKAALADVLRGAELVRWAPHVYAQSHRRVAVALAPALGENQGSYARHARLGERLRAAGLDDDPLGLLVALDWPLPTLPPLADWPAVFALSPAEVAARTRSLANPSLRAAALTGADDGDSAVALFDDGVAWIQSAAARGTGLVVFAQ